MLQYAFSLFTIHFMSYWATSIYYDDFIKNRLILCPSVERCLWNQLYGTLPMLCLFVATYPIEFNNFISSILLLPILVNGADIYFYCVHRLGHRYFWKIHKIHHKGDNYAVKSLDTHIIEHIFVNIFSISYFIYLIYFMGFVINIYVLHLWIFIITINACLTHSENYNKYSNHLVHHKYYNCNYGVGFYLIDKLLNTYKTFPRKELENQS